ncbi:hypothetical protein BaRGS_00015484 [Batillaria attramentaria]|uniref:Uncharacterized protein n=1 Tax=Batillaria attramentaria TaxID=370345 RepID=A0ABD0L1E6_9CAEN
MVSWVKCCGERNGRMGGWCCKRHFAGNRGGSTPYVLTPCPISLSPPPQLPRPHPLPSLTIHPTSSPSPPPPTKHTHIRKSLGPASSCLPVAKKTLTSRGKGKRSCAHACCARLLPLQRRYPTGPSHNPTENAAINVIRVEERTYGFFCCLHCHDMLKCVDGLVICSAVH